MNTENKILVERTLRVKNAKMSVGDEAFIKFKGDNGIFWTYATLSYLSDELAEFVTRSHPEKEIALIPSNIIQIRDRFDENRELIPFCDNIVDRMLCGELVLVMDENEYKLNKELRTDNPLYKEEKSNIIAFCEKDPDEESVTIHKTVRFPEGLSWEEYYILRQIILEEKENALYDFYSGYDVVEQALEKFEKRTGKRPEEFECSVIEF